MSLLIHDGKIVVDGLEMTLTELATLRPGFERPSDKVTVRYGGGRNVQSDGTTQTAGPAPWAAADALIAGKSALTTELEALRNPPVSVEETRAVKRVSVNALRNAKLAESLAYAFPNAMPGSIDLRDQRDLTNLQALVMNAQILAEQGIVDPVISFRDAQDQTHLLTPVQVMDMGMAVTQHQAAIYTASWTHKDAITAAVDQAALDTINITTGWPA